MAAATSCSFDRIAVRATNWVGDAVMSLPALQAVRARFPKAHIGVIARPWVADLYAREPVADEVLRYVPGDRWGLIRRLRERRFDCAILLQNAFDAALVTWLGGVRRRIGYDRDARRLLLTDPVPCPARGELLRHERFYYLELLRRAGLLPAGWTGGHDAIRLESRHAARKAGQKRFAAMGWGGFVVGVSPGAAYGGAKRWLPERFAAAATKVAAQHRGSVAVFGSGSERALCQQVAEQVRALGLPAWNFAGETSLSEFIDLAAACGAYLTNDSGAMHIASALEVPTVAVFGATDDAGTGPTGPLARVIRQPVECSPCLLRECPIDHRCMTRVDAERVAGAALELVELRPQP